MNERVFSRPDDVRGVTAPDQFELLTHSYESGGFDPRKLLSLSWRHILFLAAAVLVGLLVGTVLVLQQDPIYRASATLLFEPERIQIVEFSDVVSEPDQASGIANQIEILLSSTLLTLVAETLQGAEVKTVVAQQEEAQSSPDLLEVLRSRAMELVTADLPEPQEPEPIGQREDEDGREIRAAADSIKANLSVRQVSGSGVIELSYVSNDPNLAATVVNTIVEQYISFQHDAKNGDVLAVLELVDARIAEMRETVAESESELETARISLAETQSQSAQMTSVQLSVLNQELASIRLRLAETRSRHQRASNALSGGTELWTVTEFREAPLIIEFRRRALTVLEDVARDEAIAGSSATPSRLRSNALLEQLDRSIKEEAGFIVSALEFEVNSLKGREEQLESMVRGLELTSIEQTADELFIDRLTREVQANQTLLQTFLARQREISEQTNLQSADVRILSEADVPNRPSYEASAKTLIACSALSGLLGFLWVLGREKLNQAFRDPGELRALSGMPVLAAIPMSGFRRKLKGVATVFNKAPRGLLAESVRNLRTSVLYGDPGRQPKVVMFTSSVPDEGKSSLSLLMGMASQNTKRKTILVCGDLRDRGSAAVYASFPNVDGSKTQRSGLASYIRGECELESALAVEPISGLHILALSRSEKLDESPADLLSSDEFGETIESLREVYDLVILDTPPALAVTDARLLARVSDTIVYLVRWNHTSRNAVREGLREVRSMGAHISGCAFSMVSQRKAKKYTDNEYLFKEVYSGYFR